MSTPTSQPITPGRSKSQRPSTYYFAYYELHEIPWKLIEAIKLEVRSSGIQLQVGRGPYIVPREASPTLITSAGGARAETIREEFTLEGGTYFGIAIPADDVGWPRNGPFPEDEWNKLSQYADDAASTVGLCLNQRRPLRKVAEYIRTDNKDGIPKNMLFRWPLTAGAKAAISKRSSSSIRRALGVSLSEQVSPQTQVALRWYEQSKSAAVGADRLVSLWIALEALMGRGSHEMIVKRTAEYLTRKEFKLGPDADSIKSVLGLDQILQARNDIVHKGERMDPWPVSDDPKKRDWPQILDDVVGEILRFRFKATLQRTLGKHIKRGLELG